MLRVMSEGRGVGAYLASTSGGMLERPWPEYVPGAALALGAGGEGSAVGAGGRAGGSGGSQAERKRPARRTVARRMAALISRPGRGFGGLPHRDRGFGGSPPS